jgi:2-isopropylmalate synthase
MNVKADKDQLLAQGGHVRLPGGELYPLKPIRTKQLPAPNRYRSYHQQFVTDLPSRTWPGRILDRAPTWCSVDLRDGNQALINPLSIEQKLQFFQLLVALNFKEIEIGFPSASTVEFEFTRCLIENNLIPDDVIPQVLTQSREHLITRSFEALQGSRRAIVHLYNPTSELQRRVVYQKEMREIIEIATSGVALIKSQAANADFVTVLEYSPESFTGTELQFARDICRAALDVWQPSPSNKLIFNWPATVEMTTPNVYADQIEWMCNQFSDVRDSVVFSVHPHNDRGTGIAAAELALLAGADRVEGTLFGNGERTGNVDLITIALNLYSQGIDPQLYLGEIPTISEFAERMTEIPVNERHPYAGKLVFTAFSGSHQDAIRKGIHALKESKAPYFEVPYLTIDPADIGRAYEPLIRINSQSGKGGVAFVLESSFGYVLPKKMHVEVSAVIQGLSERSGREVQTQEILSAFSSAFINQNDPQYHLSTFGYSVIDGELSEGQNSVECQLTIRVRGSGEKRLTGTGNGPIDAARDALIRGGVPHFTVLDYSEHALGSGSNATAAAYIQVAISDGKTGWGVGQDSNTTRAAVAAMLSALNRLNS